MYYFYVAAVVGGFSVLFLYVCVCVVVALTKTQVSDKLCSKPARKKKTRYFLSEFSLVYLEITKY